MTLKLRNGKYALLCTVIPLRHLVSTAKAARLVAGRRHAAKLLPSSDMAQHMFSIVQVTYTVNDRNQLLIEHGAICSSPGVLNLTNHSYWNLDRSVRYYFAY